jgi:Flp pilus assembly pilin Flp
MRRIDLRTKLSVRHRTGLSMILLVDLLRKDDGEDLIEYGVLAAFLSVVALATIRAIGPLVGALFQDVLAALQ